MTQRYNVCFITKHPTLGFECGIVSPETYSKYIAAALGHPKPKDVDLIRAEAKLTRAIKGETLYGKRDYKSAFDVLDAALRSAGATYTDVNIGVSLIPLSPGMPHQNVPFIGSPSQLLDWIRNV